MWSSRSQLAPTIEEARELALLAQRTNRVLAAFQSRRWDGDFLAVTDLLARGVLGEVSHFESHFNRYRPIVRDRWRERAGVGSGLWYDLGPHLVDQALQLFGLPDRVIGSLAAQRAGAQSDDWAHVILEYSRLRVILHTSVLVAAPLPRFIVHGQAGSWIKHGLDVQERQLVAALTREDRPDRCRRACRARRRGQRYGERVADSARRLPAVLRAASGRAARRRQQPRAAGASDPCHRRRRSRDPIVGRGARADAAVDGGGGSGVQRDRARFHDCDQRSAFARPLAGRKRPALRGPRGSTRTWTRPLRSIGRSRTAASARDSARDRRSKTRTGRAHSCIEPARRCR